MRSYLAFTTGVPRKSICYISASWLSVYHHSHFISFPTDQILSHLCNTLCILLQYISVSFLQPVPISYFMHGSHMAACMFRQKPISPTRPEFCAYRQLIFVILLPPSFYLRRENLSFIQFYTIIMHVVLFSVSPGEIWTITTTHDKQNVEGVVSRHSLDSTTSCYKICWIWLKYSPVRFEAHVYRRNFEFKTTQKSLRIFKVFPSALWGITIGVGHLVEVAGPRTR